MTTRAKPKRSKKGRELAVIQPPSRQPGPVVDIERVVPGGYGLVRDDDGIILIRGGLPGERVQLGPLRKRGGARFGDVIKVLEASEHRQAPDCDAHPLCGGCDLLDYDPEAQRQAAVDMVKDALVRIGRLEEAALEQVVGPRSAPLYAGARRRCRVQIDRGGLPGFARRGDAKLLPRDSCAALAPRLEVALKAMFEHGKWPVGARVRLAVDDRDRVSVCFEDVSEDAGRAAAERAVALEVAHGALVLDDEGEVAFVVGDPVLEGEIAPGAKGGPYLSDAATFTQATRHGGGEIIRAVTEALDALEVGPETYVLELFSGAGHLTFPVAATGARVLSVEGASRSVEYLRANAIRGGYDGQVECVWGHIDGVSFPVDVDNFIGDDLPDVLIADPPRTGIKAFDGLLDYFPAAALILVSCDLATGARELQIAAQHGYGLARLTIIDAFPRTSHVEWVAVLLRLDDERYGESDEADIDDDDSAYDDDDGEDDSDEDGA